MKRLMLVLMICVPLGAQAQTGEFNSRRKLPPAGWDTVAFETQMTQKGGPFERVTLHSGRMYLGQNEIHTLNLGNFRYIHKLTIKAQGGSRTDGRFEVLVNGVVVGTVGYPGTDPEYVVTVKEGTSSIQFRHKEGGSAEILSVEATQSVNRINDWHPDECETDRDLESNCETRAIPLVARTEGAQLAARAIELVDILEGYADYKEYGQYLLPIKKVAARAYAVASARHSLSGAVRTQMFALLNQIKLAQCYLDNTFERDRAFRTAVALLALQEKIESALN